MAKRRGVPAVHPDRKGFATGFSSAASAVYIVVLTYLSEAMIGRLGVRLSLLAMGGVTLVVGLGCALLLVAPTEPYIAEKSALAPVPAHTGAGGNTVYYIGIGGTLLATGCVLLIRTDMAREKARLEARAAC